MAPPVEFARRGRGLGTGEALVAVLIEDGDGGVSVVTWGRRSTLDLSSRGIERCFSFRVEAGDGEGGLSRVDMEELRWVDGRKLPLGVRAGIVAWLVLSDANSFEATHTPVTSIRLRIDSVVTRGSLSVRSSAKDSELMLGVVEGEWVYEGTLGVADEEAEGIV